jgi:type IV secretion system protein VirB1
LIACAPNVDPASEAPLIAVESSGNVWALHDNSRLGAPAELAAVPRRCGGEGCGYFPRSYDEAVAAAETLVRRSESLPPCRRDGAACNGGVDVGIAQIDSVNFRGLGVDAATMLRPCANLRASAVLFTNAYETQYQLVEVRDEYARQQLALRRAYSAYNSGSAFAAPEYVDRIIAAAKSRYVQETVAYARSLKAFLARTAAP